MAGRRFDKRPDKFLNCLAVHVHKSQIGGGGDGNARLLCSLGVAALREAAVVKMDTKTAEKVATYCYRNILTRDEFGSHLLRHVWYAICTELYKCTVVFIHYFSHESFCFA